VREINLRLKILSIIRCYSPFDAISQQDHILDQANRANYLALGYSSISMVGGSAEGCDHTRIFVGGIEALCRSSEWCR
jgi:hypothetical protein